MCSVDKYKQGARQAADDRGKRTVELLKGGPLQRWLRRFHTAKDSASSRLENLLAKHIQN